MITNALGVSWDIKCQQYKPATKSNLELLLNQNGARHTKKSNTAKDFSVDECRAAMLPVTTTTCVWGVDLFYVKHNRGGAKTRKWWQWLLFNNLCLRLFKLSSARYLPFNIITLCLLSAMHFFFFLLSAKQASTLAFSATAMMDYLYYIIHQFSYKQDSQVFQKAEGVIFWSHPWINQHVKMLTFSLQRHH